MSDQDSPNQPPADLPSVPPPPAAQAPPPPPPPAPPAPPTGSGFGASSAGSLPWEDRQSLGFVEALVSSVKLFVTAPQEAFRRMREQGDYVSPLLWVAILGVVVGIFRFLTSFAFSGGNPLANLPAEMQDQLGPLISMFSGRPGIGLVILTPILAVVFTFIWAGILHLCLMAVSALGETKANFEGTFRVVAYSYIGALPSIVPFIGGLVSLVWTLYLLVVGVTTVHRTTQSKAIIAILIPLALCCVCGIVAGMVGVMGIAGLAANSQ